MIGHKWQSVCKVGDTAPICCSPLSAIPLATPAVDLRFKVTCEAQRLRKEEAALCWGLSLFAVPSPLESRLGGILFGLPVCALLTLLCGTEMVSQ